MRRFDPDPRLQILFSSLHRLAADGETPGTLRDTRSTVIALAQNHKAQFALLSETLSGQSRRLGKSLAARSDRKAGFKEVKKPRSLDSSVYGLIQPTTSCLCPR
jgi:hypothetical protein